MSSTDRHRRKWVEWMNKVALKSVLNDFLLEKAELDPSICLVVSDSRGSAGVSEFGMKFPERVIEVGIAEQNLIGIASGLSVGKMKPFVASPACFITARSLEQLKADIAYNNLPVVVVGVSSGVSYGQLGFTHHTLHDFAVMGSLANFRVFAPADAYEMKAVLQRVYEDALPTYIRIGRNAVPVVHTGVIEDFKVGQGISLKKGSDVTIIATGEMVATAVLASEIIEQSGFSVGVVSMPTIKPLDKSLIVDLASKSKILVTLEEHTVVGGLGSEVARVVSEYCPVRLKTLGFASEILVTGSSEEIKAHYGLDASGVATTICSLLRNEL